MRIYWIGRKIRGICMQEATINQFREDFPNSIRFSKGNQDLTQSTLCTISICRTEPKLRTRIGWQTHWFSQIAKIWKSLSVEEDRAVRWPSSIGLFPQLVKNMHQNHHIFLHILSANIQPTENFVLSSQHIKYFCLWSLGQGFIIRFC